MSRMPALGPQPDMQLAPIVEQVTSTGLRIVAVRSASVPLAEVRLRIPFGSASAGHSARSRVLASCVLSGTTADGVPLTERIRDLGASLSTSIDSDQILFSGSVLSGSLGELLALLAWALATPGYSDQEVASRRDRLATQLTTARSRASVRSRETLRRHLFGAHPYAYSLPDTADVASVTSADLCAWHEQRVVPAGSTLVLVGDLDPSGTIAMAEQAMSVWSRRSAIADEVPPLPSTAPAGVSRLFHRAGSVQSAIRIGGPAVRRDDPRFAALQLANLIYGGYFSSRLVENIRENKGYTYSPHSSIEHGAAGSTLVVEADVATRHTAPALLEMWYELGRLSTLRPTDSELDNARQFASGSLAMSIATQAGLASTVVTLLGDGLDLDWVREHPARLARVTAHDIYHLGVHLLAPNVLAAVVIGDATQCAEPLKAFGPWDIVGMPPASCAREGGDRDG